MLITFEWKRNGSLEMLIVWFFVIYGSYIVEIFVFLVFVLVIFFLSCLDEEIRKFIRGGNFKGNLVDERKLFI